MVMNQQCSHRSQGTVQGMKLLLLSRGRTSSKDRLFGGEQTIPGQLLELGSLEQARPPPERSRARDQGDPCCITRYQHDWRTAPGSAQYNHGTKLCLGAGEISGTKSQPADVMPAHLGPRSRLMGTTSPWLAYLGLNWKFINCNY